VVPEWADWGVAELKPRQKIHRLLGIGCHSVAVYGTKETFMNMISSGLKKKRIFIPSENKPLYWEVSSGFIAAEETFAAVPR
jgi:hypothetical protein